MSRLEAFGEEENELAKYAKALANPARISILRLLLRKRAYICGEIVEELPMSQSTISQHLKELKRQDCCGVKLWGRDFAIASRG